MLGAQFLVMERLDGRIAADDPPFTAAGWVLELTPEQRAQMCDNALAALAEVHAADVDALGLGLPRPARARRDAAGPAARLLARHLRVGRRGRGQPDDRGRLRVDRGEPARRTTGPTVLNWGDARLGNMLFADDLSVNGILDWEMVDPRHAGARPRLVAVHAAPPHRGHRHAAARGLPDARARSIARYEELTRPHGHATSTSTRCFAALRLSILMHRAGNMMIAGGMLPPDAPMKFNNPASQLLAKLIGADGAERRGAELHREPLMSDATVAVRPDDLTLDASDPRFYTEANRPAYLQIHADDPVYWVDAEHTQPFWNVCRHDLIREVGKNVDLFTTEFGVHLNAAAFTVKAATPPRRCPSRCARRTSWTPATTAALRGPLNPHFRHDNVAKLQRRDASEEIRGILAGLETGVRDGLRARVRHARAAARHDAAARRQHRARARLRAWANVVLESFEPGAQPDFAALGEMVAFFSAEAAARTASIRATT